ncbi:cuticular protein [Nesidiocoris tenuis]|uniref:Cuticular protein n=1 Tax=Nesidiocoris tenuis TaxID=355587 RepID=A0ABN7BDK0_9HEMI|nr:cuticular protein [Nesidiocoris tenuis]
MFSLVLLSAFGMAACARLDNGYLPPRGNSGAGAGVIRPPSGSYGAPSGGFGAAPGGFAAAPSGSYGAPSGFGGAPGGFGGAPGGGFRPSGPVIPIVSFQNNPNQGDGSYSYSYETGNGIKAQEAGRGGPGENQGTQAAGGFSYTGDDGQSYSISYTADEGGFRPQGAHLPTPPPIPKEILDSLASQGITVNPDGSYSGGNPNDSGAYTPEGGYGGRPSPSYGAPAARPSPSYGAPAAPRPPSGSFSPSSGYNY